MLNSTHKLLAQNPTGLGNLGTGPGFGLFTSDKVSGNPLAPIVNIISFVIGIITISAAIYFIIQFMIGAFQWLASSGDKSRLTSAQDRITHAFIGFIILIGAYGIMSLLSTLTGFDFLLQKTTTDTFVNILKGGGP